MQLTPWKGDSYSMSKLNRNKYRLVHNDLTEKTQRILADNLNSYEEAELHKQYYKCLGYAIEHLEIKPIML